MSDRIDPSIRPAPAGPCPPAGEDRIYDRGRRWCVQRDAHPDENDGHHGDAHIPAGECRTTEYFLDDIPDPNNPADTVAGGATDCETSRAGLEGREWRLSVYGASPLRSGPPRPTATTEAPASTRTTSRSLAPYIVLETWTDSGSAKEVTASSGDQWATTQVRVRLGLGEALGWPASSRSSSTQSARARTDPDCPGLGEEGRLQPGSRTAGLRRDR